MEFIDLTNDESLSTIPTQPSNSNVLDMNENNEKENDIGEEENNSSSTSQHVFNANESQIQSQMSQQSSNIQLSQRDISRCNTGKFCDEEMGIVIKYSPTFSYGKNIIESFNNMLKETSQREKWKIFYTPILSSSSSSSSSLNYDYNVILFTHRSKIYHGAGNIGDDNCELLDVAFFIINPFQFIRAAINYSIHTDSTNNTNSTNSTNSTNNELKKLMHELTYFIENEKLKSKIYSPTPMRLCIALYNMPRMISEYNSKLPSSKRLNSKTLNKYIDNAIIYCLYTLNIEIVLRKEASEIAEYIMALTSGFAVKLYKNDQELTAGFDVIKKEVYDPEDDNNVGESKEIYDLKQTWMAILQLIPQLSKPQAKRFIHCNCYTCPNKLMNDIESTLNNNINRNQLINNISRMFQENKIQKMSAIRIIKFFETLDPQLKC